VREGLEHVELDERWHVGFGLRCLAEARPAHLLDDLLDRATQAAAAWGDAVPPSARNAALAMCRRRLSVTGLLETPTAA
jgi:ribonucleoside-diphosphate reductase beta chain